MIQLNVYSSQHSVVIQFYLFLSIDLEGKPERRKEDRREGREVRKEGGKKKLSSRDF